MTYGRVKPGEPRMLALRFDTENIEEIIPGKIFAIKHLIEVLKKDNPNEKDWGFLTVKQIVELWGYNEHYDTMIEHLNNLVKRNPEYHILVYYEHGTLEQNHSVQKLLGWDIYNDKTRKFGLVGGVLFHQGEMSFHT